MRKERIRELSKNKKGINRLELCTLLSEEMDITLQEAQRMMTSLLSIITEALQDEKKVLISDFGSFQVTHRDSFEGFNPHSKERIVIPRRNIPAFKAGKRLKQQLNPSFDGELPSEEELSESSE